LVRSFFFFFRINFEFRTDFQSVDIQIQFSKEGKRLLYSITSINGRQLQRPVQSTHSPIAPIKLSGGAAHDAAKIPENATHYCWLNGADISESDATDVAANEAVMLLLGALAYLDVDESGNYCVIQSIDSIPLIMVVFSLSDRLNGKMNIHKVYLIKIDSR
jgi:hypothetical protein